MIPDFKTYIEESVWGDIRKKSLGQEVRVEDQVNLMGGDRLINYLNEYYEIAKVGVTNAIYISEGGDLVSVFVLFDNAHEPGIVEIANPGTDKIRITIPGYFIEPTEHTRIIDYNLKNEILNNYSVHSKNAGEFYEVFPKDESQITNQFFINFIDFLLINAGDKHDKVIKKR